MDTAHCSHTCTDNSPSAAQPVAYLREKILKAISGPVCARCKSRPGWTEEECRASDCHALYGVEADAVLRVLGEELYGVNGAPPGSQENTYTEMQGYQPPAAVAEAWRKHGPSTHPGKEGYEMYAAAHCMVNERPERADLVKLVYTFIERDRRDRERIAWLAEKLSQYCQVSNAADCGVNKGDCPRMAGCYCPDVEKEEWLAAADAAVIKDKG